VRRYWGLLTEEVRREWIITARYWMNSFSFAITVYLVFLLLLFTGSGMSGGAVSADAKAGALVGVLMWQLSMGCMGVLGWSFYNESATGTLEHLYLSPLGVTSIFLARSVANFLSTVAVTLVAAALSMWTTGVRLDLPPLELAVILPLAVAGTYGFGFMLAALTLTFKRTQQLMNLTQFFFLFFSGAVMPLEQMHWTLRAFGQTLPTTAGLEALRAVTIAGARLGDVTGLLGQMAVTSVLWLAVGVVIYKLADRRARLRGSIGQY
jgi:ABC-2 type transport system permease protein